MCFGFLYCREEGPFCVVGGYGTVAWEVGRPEADVACDSIIGREVDVGVGAGIRTSDGERGSRVVECGAFGKEQL